MHFSPTARAQSVRDQTVLITSFAHSPKSITLNRRSLLALPPSRAQTLAYAAFSLRDTTEDRLRFNGEIYIWGVAPNPTQETFWKKFLVNLQKLFKIKGFSNVFMHFSKVTRA